MIVIIFIMIILIIVITITVTTVVIILTLVTVTITTTITIIRRIVIITVIIMSSKPVSSLRANFVQLLQFYIFVQCQILFRLLPSSVVMFISIETF